MVQLQTPTPVPPRPVPPPAGSGAAGALPLVTVGLLAAADGSNGADYYGRIVDAINLCAHTYLVDTPLRLAHFLAQIGHESGFRATEEDGRYSAARMREIFGCKGGAAHYDKAAGDCAIGADGKPARLRPKLWTAEATYAGNARNLLSYVYALRLGNGDEVSGDGYRYRGRGLIQLTGKSNYQSFTDCHNTKNPDDRRDFVANPDLLVSELNYAIESAFYFWDARDINQAADQDDVVEVTRRVNGGLNGLADREARLARIKTALGA
jgi:predicted chitinase